MINEAEKLSRKPGPVHDGRNVMTSRPGMNPVREAAQTCLMAGSARVNITPPVGLPMDGYSDRQGEAVGVHDALWAKALVLEIGSRRIAFVCCDLVGIDPAIVRQVRDAVAVLPGDTTIFLSATHTHAGPAGARAPLNETVVRLVTDGIVRAFHMAMQCRVPARVGSGWGRADGVGANRRDPTMPYDPVLGVLRVDALAGTTIALLVNFACHPTVLPASNLLYSGDYPGAAVAEIERHLDHAAVAFFTNGAAGDISTRFTRLASSFEESERLGGILARAVLDVHGRIDPRPVHRVASATCIVQLPPSPTPSVETVEAELERARRHLKATRAAGESSGQARIAHTTVQGLERQLARARQGVASPVAAEVGAFAINGICGVAWPGEVFNAFAVELRQRWQAPVFVLGYTNGLVGYVPSPEAFATGGYEATSARVGPTAGALIVETSLALLHDVATSV
ncbi:MAG: neutral/alkaline non-lysosomal ceramidase N-terminal domain-containing protein [Armatimonadota bacterium]|nr:neutral/alkaline non-lysosomal ceramidase N-terminal domain-containing protein [Armatimonadota bacterium]